jgi:hypothetical protein
MNNTTGYDSIPTATETEIASIRRRATDAGYRRMRTYGVRLTPAQVDEIGEVGYQWLCERVGLVDVHDSSEVLTMARATDPTPGAWHVPPSCQGQAVERAYGVDEDGDGWLRVTDRSRPMTPVEERVTYYHLGTIVEDAWGPANSEPRAGRDYEAE